MSADPNRYRAVALRYLGSHPLAVRLAEAEARLNVCVPRPLEVRFNVAVTAGDLVEAERLVDEFEALAVAKVAGGGT